MAMLKKLPLSSFVLTLVISCFTLVNSCDVDDDCQIIDTGDQDTTQVVDTTTTPYSNTKMDGISFVSPPNEFEEFHFGHIDSIAANWMAISPFAFSSSNTSPGVQFNPNFQWWGETEEGVNTTIDYCRGRNMKIMLKPQVWIPSGGWVGHYNPGIEAGWQTWEEQYRDYIMIFVNIAIERDVEVFCVGTEYKIAAVEREPFWRQLIADIRAIYDGELVYASNWDHYQNIAFWDELDYIGVDSYFPLVDAVTPTVEEIDAAWPPVKQQLADFSNQHGKQILFCEFGYMSIDHGAWQNWENEGNQANLNVNMVAQRNAFESFFKNIWEEDWFAGGFIWKWYHDHPNAGGPTHKEYTPQNKLAEKVIKQWYTE